MAALEPPPDKWGSVLSIERGGQRFGFNEAPKIRGAFGPGDEPRPPGLDGVRGMTNNYNATGMDATRLENYLALSRRETQAGMKLPPTVTQHPISATIPKHRLALQAHPTERALISARCRGNRGRRISCRAPFVPCRAVR